MQGFSDEPQFIRIRGGAQILPGTARAARVGRYEVAIFNLGGELYALENSCPHQGGPLADGWFEDGRITCPWHGWCFDVRTGEMTLGSFARVPRFAVVRDGPDVLVASRPLEEP